MSAPQYTAPANGGGGGGGTVTGSGTTGTIPVWSSATALGDSPLTVSAGTVSGGPVTLTGLFEIRSGNYLMMRRSDNGWDMRLQQNATRLDVYSGADLVNPIACFHNGGGVTIGTTTVTSGRALTTVADLDVYGVRIGRGAGANSENVAVGQFALNSNTSGSGNAAVGAEALTSNSTGAESSAVGKYALRFTTGSRNTGIGAGAGNNVTSGTDNVCVGWYATAAAATNNNSIVIGSNLVGNGSNTVTIGNSSITDNYFNGVIRLGNAAQGVRLPSTPTNSNANTLDCYEEGTWTATDTSAAALGTLGTGTYTRIGRTVIAQVTVTYPTTASTAAAGISLPIALTTASTNFGGASIGYVSGGTKSNLTAQVSTGTTPATDSRIRFWTYNGTGAVNNVDFTGLTISLTVCYNIA